MRPSFWEFSGVAAGSRRSGPVLAGLAWFLMVQGVMPGCPTRCRGVLCVLQADGLAYPLLFFPACALRALPVERWVYGMDQFAFYFG